MKLIVAGSRDFNDYERVSKILGQIHFVFVTSNKQPMEIICGMARGADMLGHRWATENNIPIIEMPADWNKYGKRAGHLRNEEMAKIATHVLVFWDGKSRGTKNMIDLAWKYDRHLRIEKFDAA